MYLNVMPYLVYVISVVFEPFVNGGDSPLAAAVIISDKVLTVFIDGIVGQVHVHITLCVCVCV